MNPPTFAFDLTSYSWTTLAERPLQGNHHGVAVLRSPSGEDEIYLVGGFGGGSEGQMQVYNVTGDSWRIGAELGGHVDGSVNVVAIDNRIYACGGLKLSPIPNTAGVNPETCKRWVRAWEGEEERGRRGDMEEGAIESRLPPLKCHWCNALLLLQV